MLCWSKWIVWWFIFRIGFCWDPGGRKYSKCPSGFRLTLLFIISLNQNKYGIIIQAWEHSEFCRKVWKLVNSKFFMNSFIRIYIWECCLMWRSFLCAWNLIWNQKVPVICNSSICVWMFQENTYYQEPVGSLIIWLKKHMFSQEDPRGPCPPLFICFKKR